MKPLTSLTNVDGEYMTSKTKHCHQPHTRYSTLREREKENILDVPNTGDKFCEGATWVESLIKVGGSSSGIRRPPPFLSKGKNVGVGQDSKWTKGTHAGGRERLT